MIEISDVDLSVGDANRAALRVPSPAATWRSSRTPRYGRTIPRAGSWTWLLDKLTAHPTIPVTARRVNEDEVSILANGPLDVLQGGVTPTVRPRATSKLVSGANRAAAGVTPTPTVDPVLGQGGNMASYGRARAGLRRIVSADVFDDGLLRPSRRAPALDRVSGAPPGWTNFNAVRPEHFA